MVEDAVLKAMQEWFTEYTIKVDTEDVPQSNNIETALSVVREQLTELHLQQDKICELLEKGIYTVDMFSKRNSALEKEIRKLQSSETDLLEKSKSQKEFQSKMAEVIPTTQHILDSYEQLSIQEKIDCGR